MQLTNEYVAQWIHDYMADPAKNTMKKLPGFAFAEPLVGFSSAADLLYPFYKEHIDPNFYRLPTEWLQSACGKAFAPEEVSVISWVMPQTEDTRKKSAALEDHAPLEWLMVRIHGEECNRDMASALAAHLNELGYEAVAPMSSSEFSWGDSEKYKIISNWSERHTALISGLGTFGLCDGLISKKGKAVRYGSVIVHAKLTPTPREYTEYNEYCQAKNGCTACIRRCPAGAITLEGGHNKEKCQAYQAQVLKEYYKKEFNHEGLSVCGLCQTGVPCECGVPPKMK